MFPISDPVLVFTILAMAMLVSPLISERLRVPDLVFLLAFGAALGPNGFHIIERNSAVTLLGAVGMLYIMFLAGIEIDLYRFMRSYKRSVIFGLLTFAIPQVLGTLVGRFVLGMSWTASLLLASMFASHTLLAYPIASRLGISRSEPVAVTVGATIITDTLSLLVLAVIADSARGVSLGAGFWSTIVLGMIALVALTWWGIPVAARWFFQRVPEKGNAQFLFVIVTVCGCAWLSHFARMEPIIGAFLAGAAFNRLIPENSALMTRVTFAGNTLFIPFFLISVGMLVDVPAIFSGARGLIVGTAMVATVIVTKYLAAHAARLLFGYDRAAGEVMFGLSVVQAAATLAAVVVGYELNIFDEAVLNGAIMMIVVACPLGSWVVDRCGRRMAAGAPARVVAPPPAEQRILVPVAKPASASKLLDLSFLLHSAARPGGIYPLTIAREQAYSEAAVAQGEKLLGHCLAHAAAADIQVHPELRVSANVSDGIIQTARELRAALAVVGWSGEQSASIRIFGTVMQHLVESCPARLLFCRLNHPLNTARRLLVPFPSLSPRLRDLPALLRDTKMLAHQTGAELKLFAVASDTAALRALVEKIKPDCKTTVEENTSWNKLQTRLFDEIGADDIILLPVDRRDGIQWAPALDRLPEIIVKRFPTASLLVAYPSMPGRETPADENEADDLPELTAIDVNEKETLETALKQLTGSIFNDPAQARELFRYFQTAAGAFPVELAPRTALLHARFGDLPRPQLAVIRIPAGWPTPDLPEPPQTILVLIDPHSKPPEHHLKNLSFIARRIRDIRTRLDTTAAEICAMFK